MRSALVLLAAMAMPAAARNSGEIKTRPVPMPVSMDVTAMRPGTTRITLEELLAFCMLHAPADEPKPVPQRWRST